jgi:dTMP kinase
MKGKFVTFEGSEGSGKSTQIKAAENYLLEKGQDVLVLREPGGTLIGEEIREILLQTDKTEMSNECETFLYMAARAQLVKEMILPALHDGRIVICDRFLDSTVAYQGYGHGIDVNLIKDMDHFATEGIEPHLTFLFDLNVEEGFARINRPKDRIELRSINYHNRVRSGYIKIAREEPERIKVIDASDSPAEIELIVQRELDNLLSK